MYKFYFVNKVVKPKRIKLKQSTEKAQKLQKELAEKQKVYRAAMDKVDKLNKELNSTIRQKEALQKDYSDKSTQLSRAKILISSLGGEKGRWKELAEELRATYITLTGDVLVSSGLIGYLGAFTPSYRSEILKDWVDQCLKRKIPSSP